MIKENNLNSKDLDKREKKLMETLTRQDLKNSKKAMENKIMLDIM